MSLIQSVLVLGFLISLTGNLLYFRAMVRGEARPSRVTSIIWALQAAIALAAAWEGGVRWALIPVTFAFVGPMAALTLSYALKQAEWKTTRFDFVCGVLSVIGLVWWQATDNPNVAIALVILADFIGAVPTIKKSWLFPRSEALVGYALSAIGYATSFAALERYSFAEIAFPAWCVLVSALISALIILGRRREEAAGAKAGPL